MSQRKHRNIVQQKPARNRKKKIFDPKSHHWFEHQGFELSLNQAEYYAFKVMSKGEKKKYVLEQRKRVSEKKIKKIRIRMKNEHGIKIPVYFYVPFNWKPSKEIENEIYTEREHSTD